MKEREILHKICNKLTLPMSVLEVVRQAGSNCQRAQDQIKELIEELRKGMDDETSHQ